MACVSKPFGPLQLSSERKSSTAIIRTSHRLVEAAGGCKLDSASRLRSYCCCCCKVRGFVQAAIAGARNAMPLFCRERRVLRVCCLIRPIGGGGRGKNLVAAALRPLSTDGQPCDEHLTHQLLLEPLRKPMPRPIIHSHLTSTSRSMRPSLEQRANGRQGAGQQVRPPGTEHPPRAILAAHEVKHLDHLVSRSSYRERDFTDTPD